MSLRKTIKNVLKYGIGEQAKARRQAGKAEARQGKFESQRWDREADEVHRRYESYADYVKHQAGKLTRIQERVERKEADRFEGFKARFRSSKAFDGCKNVLCLGARLGAEVRALHKLGHFAVGLDLNPGEKNFHVLPGDFHNIVFPDQSVDVIYTNALDHVYDLKSVMKEVYRLLKPKGIFVTDVVPGFEEGFTPGEYESHHWPTVKKLEAQILGAANLVQDSHRELGECGGELWIQLEFHKEDSLAVPHEQAGEETVD